MIRCTLACTSTETCHDLLRHGGLVSPRLLKRFGKRNMSLYGVIISSVGHVIFLQIDRLQLGRHLQLRDPWYRLCASRSRHLQLPQRGLNMASGRPYPSGESLSLLRRLRQHEGRFGLLTQLSPGLFLLRWLSTLHLPPGAVIVSGRHQHDRLHHEWGGPIFVWAVLLPRPVLLQAR